MRNLARRYFSARPVPSSNFISNTSGPSSSTRPAQSFNPTSNSLEAQIQELTKSRRVEDAERLLVQSVDAGARPVTRVYNHVIHALARLGRVDKCREWLTRMKNRPDVYTYSAIFNAYVRASKRRPNTCHTEGALEMWHRMQRENVKPHTICINTFLAVLIENGDTKLANDHLTKCLDTKLLQPNVFTFAPFLNMCAKNGDAKTANMWLEKMKEYQVNPDAHLYQNAMEAHAKNSDATSAHKIFDNMVAARVDQDAHCHGWKTISQRKSENDKNRVQNHIFCSYFV